MKSRAILFLTLSTTALLMSACSPMNSEFSCNATANDSCMTIEQVDAMTRYADGDNHHGHYQASRRGSAVDARNKDFPYRKARVFVAPRSMK